MNAKLPRPAPKGPKPLASPAPPPPRYTGTTIRVIIEDRSRAGAVEPAKN